MKRILLSLAAAALLLGGDGVAHAGPLGLFNTGVDASGASLPNGSGDPHYSLISVPGGTTDIRVATSANGFPIPPWIGDSAISAWIGPNSDGALDGPPGVYDYRTTFTLASAASLVTILGQWATDDQGIDILLNGVSTGNVANGFQSFTPFAISGPGLAGTNTLDFMVVNGGNSDNPTGLRVEFTSATAVPEPATMTMLGFGIAGLVGYGWRRRKTMGLAAV